MVEKLVVVTRKTRLEALIERFNTRAQARFVIEHAGGDFNAYTTEHDAYHRSLDRVLSQLGQISELKRQVLEQALVPTYLFSEQDLVVCVGPDGLVANVAKYVGAQPIVGINPDPARIDGVLLPFEPVEVDHAVAAVLENRAQVRQVTLAEAVLADGQRMLAFNDLFVGAASHVSARYRIRWGEVAEAQSSSGVLVSTGAGSTGWMSSVFSMAQAVASFTGGRSGPPVRLSWEDPRLLFAVREPFVSRHSAASLATGWIGEGEVLEIESLMPQGGVIFSDGIENDFLRFEAGAVARIRTAVQRARLVVKGARAPKR